MTEKDKVKIDAMTREEMASIWRFTPTGGWPFNDRETGEYFKERFMSLGGMSPEISKMLGW